MNIQLIKASGDDGRHIISNLMQLYMYDFSEYTKSDVEPNGLFGEYPDLGAYWKEENHRFPYIITKNEKHIGFVFVRIIGTGEEYYFSIAEFFVMRKYRREGVGRIAAEQIFDLHKGKWEVYQMEANKPAQSFWRRVIQVYTRGKFTERMENGRILQRFNN
jgi:predicted acetyltransferase